MPNDKLKPKIIFMGTPAFASEILRALTSNQYNISAVFTRPDKKTGRNQDLQKSAVKIVAEEAGLTIFDPEKLDEDAIKKINSIKPDLIVVAAYGKILPGVILKIPKYGSINVHASLLPIWRGPSPIQNALLHGDKETGITLMLMDEGIDTGEIVAQEKTEIGPDETFSELSQRLASLGAQVVAKTIPLWLEGKIDSRPQDNSQALICQLIERADGKVNWADEAREIYNRYRALTPWPGLYTFWEKNASNLRLKLNRIGISDKIHPGKFRIGEVFAMDNETGVQTAEGVIILKELQLEGKNNMPIAEFLKGYSDLTGAVFK